MTGIGLVPGTYTITQGPESADDLTGLSCSPNETTNLSTRTATVTLAVGEHVTCTFVDTPGGPTLPVRCWGMNQFGQVGDGTTTTRLLPVVVSDIEGTGALADVDQVVVVGRGTCAVLTDGQARCWGTQALGDGSSGSLRPARVLIH